MFNICATSGTRQNYKQNDHYLDKQVILYQTHTISSINDVISNRLQFFLVPLVVQKSYE